MIHVKVRKSGDTVLAPELGEHVATITVRGCECQRATSKGPAAYREADTGGKGSFREVSHAKNSSCQPSLQLHTSPLSAPSPASASGSQRDTQSCSQRLTEDTLLQAQP